MSKIVQAVNVMIANKDKISAVKKGAYSTAYYFVYNSKYVWSIAQYADGDITICNYPVDIFESPESYVMTLFAENEKSNPDCVCYNTEEYHTREAIESFRELYNLVKEKNLGVDLILDEIIKEGDDVPF
ncbi:MAG: hypothetical protein CSYNP_01282 [Syntrophus sp. SKADARSKE-3]|nr:hypothetical protein [Syntrophus sp. SKADARSKE-3]